MNHGVRQAMPDQSLLTVLHLSDFHHTRRKFREQEIVVNALVADLETLCIGHRRPDVIIFTGDLVNAAGSDSHLEAYDRFIAKIAAVTNCSAERIFIAPGNHDASQDFVTRSLVEHDRWRGAANDMAKVNAMYDANEFADISNEKFANYIELSKYVGNDGAVYSNEFVSVHRIAQLNIDIVCLNTAVLSYAGLAGHPKDDRNLVIPEYAVRDAIAHLTVGSFRIFTGHHPFSNLSENGERYLRSVVQREANVHLFGHMHVPLTQNTMSYEGEMLSNQSGAIFTSREKAYIGYSLICIDRGQSLFETNLRTFFNDRSAFDAAVDVLAEGKFYSSQKAREFWRTIAQPVDDEQFREFLANRCRAAIEAGEQDGLSLGERGSHEMFVAPRLMRSKVAATSKSDEKLPVQVPVSFEEIVNRDDNIIMYAAAEYGRTTVIKEIAYRLAADAADIRFPRLPIVIDFGDIKINTASLLRLVKSQSPCNYDGADAESLIKLGHACVMFDDVVFSDHRRMNILRAFVSSYPKVRYIFSSLRDTAAPFGTHVAPEMPVRFDFVELCEFRRRDMRQLVAKYRTDDEIDIVLDRLQSEISEINLPFTAANGSILMEIYEAQSGFRPVNRSVIIEQFIDVSLKKGAIDQGKRVTFDYSNKTALLAHVSAWMCTNNLYVVPVDVIRDVMRKYIDQLGLNADIESLLSEFWRARIFLKRSDERLSFRYRGVLEYFVALQMINDPKFKEWVMDPAQFLQYTNEIQYFAGKVRNDAEMVHEIGQRFDALLNETVLIFGDMPPETLATLQVPRAKQKEALDHLTQQLTRVPLNADERDEELEGDIPRDVENRQEVFRPRVDDPGQRLLVALFLYSGVLKNMELIDDADKRKHLAVVWRGWAILLYLSLVIVADLVRHRRMRLNGVLYVLDAPMGISDEELARNITLNLPTGVTKLISATLGTEKLERQLTEPQLDEHKRPLIYEFFRASLIADLRLKQTAAAIRIALEYLSDSPYLLESLVWKVADLRRMAKISEDDFQAVTGPLAGALATLKGTEGRARDQEKRKQLARLKHDGIVLKLKRQAEED
jgi:predicted MPP superfamily phosphohydrolase